MFSGIIYDVGKIKSRIIRGKNTQLSIVLNKDMLQPERGMSIAVNGVCLTAVSFRGKKEFTADISGETISKTSLKSVKNGDKVNLELPLTADKFLSGHIVQGHVDTEGRVEAFIRKSSDFLLEVSYPAEYDKYLVEKGSIAVDGVSLTVYNTRGRRFTVSVIPETVKGTIISGYKKGTKVNLEFDIIGKYVVKALKKQVLL